MSTEQTTEPLQVRVLVSDGGQLEEPEQETDEETAQEAEEAEEETEAEEEAEDGETEEAEGEEDGGDEDESEAEEGEEAEAEEDEEEAEAEEETEAEEDEEEAEAEEETEAEEGEEEEDEREEKIAEEGTRLVHLNLDGLFLDLLGLEVDLDEVTLNLTASPGEGKLLGNLLSAVGGLFDSPGLGELLSFGDGESEDEGGSLLSGLMPSLPELNPMERARNLASALAERLRELLGEVISALPLEELLTQFLETLVNQLLNGGNGDETEDAATA